MTVPFLGPLTISGFAHPWYFLFLLVVVGVVGLDVWVQLSRSQRVLRFANTELLSSVAPKRPNRWRHLPAVPLVVSLLLSHSEVGRPQTCGSRETVRSSC